MFNDPQFWVFVAFIIFFAAVYKPIKKILISTLDNKIDEIKNKINEAETIKKEAQQALSEIKIRRNEISLEISKIQEESEKKIFSIEENAYTKLKEQINKKMELLQIKIDQMTREAKIEIQKYVINTAINATIQLIKEKLNQEEKQILIYQSIKELNLILKH